MKNQLKKINFLKRFSLVQQLIILLSFIALILVAVMMPLVDYNLKSIIDNQTYENISNEQDWIIYNSYEPSNKNKKVFHILYDSSKQTIISTNIPNTTMINYFLYYLLDEDLVMLQDNSLKSERKCKNKIDGETYYYIITPVGQTRYLISIQNNDYSYDLITSLRNQTIYIQYIFFIVIAFVLIIWVLSLINPLKKIKNYIDMIKKREDCSLSIDREDEIGVVSQALVEMKEDLERQEKIKEEMIHNISHDLKTPIALIKTYGQSVKDDIYPYGDKDASMDVILENADRLDHKVKSFLYLNRLDYLQGENQEVGTFEIKLLIEKIVNQMDLLKPEIRLETDLEDVCFIGDEEHWRVAIENIIENASRYAKSLIKITLKDQYLEIYNDGEQIEEAIIPFLFDPYAKGVKGQFGLGLSIVHKIASMFSYDVDAKNQEIGVSFIFTKKNTY